MRAWLKKCDPSIAVLSVLLAAVIVFLLYQILAEHEAPAPLEMIRTECDTGEA